MNIAFLGDSITLGYALENKEKRYATLVAEKLGMREENYGITGTLVAKAGLNDSDGKDFVSRAHLIDEADVAVVFGGTNDYFWSDKPIYGEGDKYFAYALETIIARIKDKRNGKVTLFVTPYRHNGIGNYLGGEGFRVSSRHDTDAVNYNGHTIEDYVKAITDVCEKHGIPCLDLYNEFDFDWHIHTSDGCHPNEDGHRVIAERIAAELKVLLGIDNK